MTVNTLFFGIVMDITGERKISFDLQKEITIREFQEYLLKKYPGLTDIKIFAFAVNESYVKDDHQIQENDVVAVIPPVSGG